PGPPSPTALTAPPLLGALPLLTELGRRCSRWPTHPRLAALLDSATHHNCLPLACWVVAWVEEAIGGPEIDIAQVLENLPRASSRSEEHASELQSRENTVCRLLP